MGGCGSKSASSGAINAANQLRKINARGRHVEDDELTEVDLERINEQMRQRQQQEDELSRLIYAEKEALKVITSRLIEKRDSCESLMDKLESSEILDISTDEASFRAQKRFRRKVIKRTQNKNHHWVVSVTQNSV